MSEQRIFFFDEITPVEVQMRGGNGKGLARKFFDPSGMVPGSPFTAGSITVFPPGASVGVHKHEGDAEVYIVMSGSGLYTNRDGEKVRMKAGDVAFCYDGEIHGIENDGTEPLTMVGIIAK